MFVERRAHGDAEVSGAFKHGEGFRALHLIEQAQSLDDSFFRREIAIEIAGAHPGLVRNLRHRGGVKTVADEGALGGVQNMGAPFVFRQASGRGEAGKAHGERLLRMNVHSRDTGMWRFRGATKLRAKM